MLKKRPNVDQQKDDQFKDLLIFGYSSKLFRDDEKALEIDRGKHLIPWMGDESLMIDRYDGRGYLDDVKLFTPDSIFEVIMTEEEKAREKELDEERYMDLNVDIEQKLLMEEEEMKRSKESEVKYGAVSFQYEEKEEEEHPNQDREEQADDLSQEFEPFIPHERMNLPPDMERPKTLKHHKIIEKTAAFISKQSLQMEILIKTRQKDNPAFNFLNFGDELHPYYKHLVSEMKNGRYTFESEKEEDEEKTKEAKQEHVEIQISSQDFLKSVEEKLPPRLVKDTCYDKLLNNLRKHIPVQQPPPPPEIAQTPPAAPCPKSPSEEPGSTPPKQMIEIHGQGQQATASESQKSNIVPPPPDKKFLIDKMASYVTRNGPDFEVVVRKKNDPRFDFITEGHVWHNYYQMRKAILRQEILDMKPRNPSGPLQDVKSADAKMELKSICFSIKSKDAAEKVVKQNILVDDEAKANEQHTYSNESTKDDTVAKSGNVTVGLSTFVTGVQAQVIEPSDKSLAAIRKRSHSPDSSVPFKKSKSPEYDESRHTSAADSLPKYQLPLFGPKPHSTARASRSPVYGPDLPPQEYLESIRGRTSGSGRSQKSDERPEVDTNATLKSRFDVTLANGLKSSTNLSREPNGRRAERKRSRSKSGGRRRSKEQCRSKRGEGSRSRGRTRSRERNKDGSRPKRRSPDSNRKSRRISPKSHSRPSRKLPLNGPLESQQAKRGSAGRSRSRDSERRKKSKKAKHNKKHKHHHHHHHRKEERSNKMVVLDLTKEDVVDLTED